MQSKYSQSIEVLSYLIKHEIKEKDITPVIEIFSKVLANSNITDQVISKIKFV